MRKQRPELLDRHQAADLLNVSLRQLELRSASGEIPGFVKPFGTTARWSRSALMAWIRRGCPDIRIPQRSANSESGIDDDQECDNFLTHD